MASQLPENFETLMPSKGETQLALESSRQLATRRIGNRGRVRLQVLDDEGEEISVPASAFRLFLQVLSEMSQGNAVTLIPTHAELTTQQAADVLNVSRPYVVKLLDEERIPSRTVGKYRRVRFDDLMAYKQKDDESRQKVLDQLSSEGQELEMGY
jgi:DNA binding domain, excisionase family